MIVKDLSNKFGYRLITENSTGLETKINGIYACDLLSHAMAKINTGDVWVTVHTNLNVVAVASLTEASCVVVPENIEIEQQTIERAKKTGVIFLSAPVSASQICYDVLSALKEIK
ncbi:MAG: hypothetical protein GX957_06420 [Clostridiaceae bacterium]|nr:hypothetical protein [Clostridiaceae bacterium]